MTCYQHREQEERLSVQCGPPSYVSLAELCLPVAMMLVGSWTDLCWRVDHVCGGVIVKAGPLLSRPLLSCRGLGLLFLGIEVWPFL